MAVYTEVPDGDLTAFLDLYDVGHVVACKGIAEGVENTNYLLQTTSGNFILTLYEKRVAREDLPFFLGLMEHLAAKGLSCPTPIKARDGQALHELCGRPAVIVSFLNGVWPRRPTEKHCQQLGTALADFHLKGRDFQIKRTNNLSIAGWHKLVEATKARADEVSPGLAAAIVDELAALDAAWPTKLEIGVIHADLFPDNVFFLEDRLSGLIDFYFACTDFLAYDLAVCINAWCFEQNGSFNVTKARLLVRSYNAVRPIPAAEMQALPILCRGSALRFLLTRLYDWLNHPAGAFVKPKDPLEYLRKLRFHQQASSVAAYGVD